MWAPWLLRCGAYSAGTRVGMILYAIHLAVSMRRSTAPSANDVVFRQKPIGEFASRFSRSVPSYLCS